MIHLQETYVDINIRVDRVSTQNFLNKSELFRLNILSTIIMNLSLPQELSVKPSTSLMLGR